MRPPPPKLCDDPVGFVLQAARNDLVLTQRRSLQECLISSLASQMYGDAMVLAMLMEQDRQEAIAAEEAMFHGKAMGASDERHADD